jgi:predicted HicB family RNase H-like nuclease
MFQSHNYNDRRAKYPEVVTTRVPTELREAVKQIAATEHVSMHEFIRRAIGERIERLTRNSDGHGSLSPFCAGA